MANDMYDLSSEAGENTMLHEAMEAIRHGDRVRARDLLTRLLKADQNNATYWVWLSAVVDSTKERLYCLQTALKLDPNNASAKRGLVFLGGIPPDDSVPPFPLNRPRSWEESISIPKEPTEKHRGLASSFARLLKIVGITILAAGLLFGGYFLFVPGGVRTAIVRTPTRRPTFTISPTHTITPAFRTATPTFLGPTPLSFFLANPYTPTPLYVVTEHPVLTRSLFDAGLRLLADNEYEVARVQFQLVLQSEPEAVDAYYYIAESHRLEGNFEKARDACQVAIEINPSFAPALLCRAMANQAIDPDADVQADLDNAIVLDPQFPDAYIQRAAWQSSHGNPLAAISDLETALELRPDSATAWMHLAQAQLATGNGALALESALYANQLDITLVPVYLTLAQAYIATGQTDQAVSVLQTYMLYAPNDKDAYLSVGLAYLSVGDNQAALEAFNQYLDKYPRNAEALFQRGLTYLNLDNPNLAEEDFKKAATIDPFDFDAQLGLARAFFNQGLPGDAYIQAEKNALPLAKSDKTLAQSYYWIAIFLEGIGDEISGQGARNYWYKLISLPADAMPEEWRTSAYDHLGITPTFTPTLRPSKTPTKQP